MIETLRALRKKVVIGFVGGSDLKKIREQLEIGIDDGMDVILLRRIDGNLSRGFVSHSGIRLLFCGERSDSIQTRKRIAISLFHPLPG